MNCWLCENQTYCEVHDPEMFERIEMTATCGRIGKNGRVCTREVAVPGPCWQHRTREDYLAAVKSEANQIPAMPEIAPEEEIVSVVKRLFAKIDELQEQNIKLRGKLLEIQAICMDK